MGATCPSTSRELSGGLGGIAAIGVVSVSDVKCVLDTGDFAVLHKPLSDFIAWRSTAVHADASTTVCSKRFNVVSVDQETTLHMLASALVASQLQRVFLSSEEIGRIVGVVSPRDIVSELFDGIAQSPK